MPKALQKYMAPISILNKMLGTKDHQRNKGTLSEATRGYQELNRRGFRPRDEAGTKTGTNQKLSKLLE